MSLTRRQRELVRDHLKQLLSSDDFCKAEKLQQFLKFIVEKTLAGGAAIIKETTIGHEVYGQPDDYDPKINRIVATEAIRLRDKLAKAQRPGDLVVFEIPKGGYIPEFRFRGVRPFNLKWWLLLAIPIVAGILVLWWTFSKKHRGGPAIEFTSVPHADCGGPVGTEEIAGKVSGAAPSQFRLAIYSEGCDRVLYIEPKTKAPFTTIRPDGEFDTQIYLGQTYYVLLVKPAFKPESQLTTPPQAGGDIVLVAKIRGKPR